MGDAHLTRAEQAEFLKLYVEARFNVREACRRLGRHYTTIYRQLRSDEEFATAFAECKQLAAGEAFAEAYRRAVYGYDEPQFYKGEPVYEIDEATGERRQAVIRKYSDSLLAQVLRAIHPDFRERSRLEISGPGGGPIELTDTQLAAKLAAVLAAAERRMIEGECVDVTDQRALPAPDGDGDALPAEIERGEPLAVDNSLDDAGRLDANDNRDDDSDDTPLV